MLFKCGTERESYDYPVEKVDWEKMADADQATWLSSNIRPQTNEELVRLGVFHGKFTFLRARISIFSFLIFLILLDLLSIRDSAGNPRSGLRRGELWSKLAFNISKAPFQLICELERMSRGKTRLRESYGPGIEHVKCEDAFVKSIKAIV